MRRLALAYPEHAALLNLDIRIIDKNGSPFNGYVDALAFTWGSPTAASKARLKASQLPGACFLEGDAEQILRAWESLERGITVRAEDWSRLLAQPDAEITGGLTATVLQRLGEACHNDARLWRDFIDETRRHLDSKAIRLATLGKQIDWLEHYRPDAEQIPPAPASALADHAPGALQSRRRAGTRLDDSNATPGRAIARRRRALGMLG
ncbi:MAG: hypothetical protein CVV13_14125 [Gammaproteobacteria bacterium HGW-Gammaproteobacteria-3]|nr:MAG: hypothetical protein CVV13_14125 [Gammaproteobacteria bacterium HGW-Gammaproteobacteria-3]